MALSAQNYRRELAWPILLSDLIHQMVKREGYDITDTENLAPAVVQLSSLYTQERVHLREIWQSPAHRAAYWAYFMPLNFVRLQAVLLEAAKRRFLEGFEQVVDFGSGPGTAHLVWHFLQITSPVYKYSWEASKEAQKLHQSWLIEHKLSTQFIQQPQNIDFNKKTLGVFSYSLNELKALPNWISSLHGALIVEPSMQKPGRQLMTWRAQMLQQGFHAWAPCVHQYECPLLKDSKTDWCHDRIFLDAPEWFLQLENQLPMQNRSLTFSYLLLRREEPPPFSTPVARLIGDTLNEKGKVRQMLCRGPNREFLSWLKKHGEPPRMERGHLIKIPHDLSLKGSELRVLQELEYFD